MAKDKFAWVESSLGDKLRLRRAQGHEELGRPFKYVVDLLGSDEAIEPSAVLGKDMTLILSLEDENKERYVNGLVTGFVATGHVGSHTTYRAQLEPWIALLGRTSDCRVFQQETVPNILRQLFKDNGFDAFRFSLTGTYKPLEYVTQYRETTLNFMSRLLEKAGIYYFFEHKKGDHTLVLADSASAHQTAEGYATVPYFPPEPHHAREHEHFYGWHLKHAVRPGKVALTDFDFKRPTADLTAETDKPKEHEKAKFELFDYPGGYVEGDDGTELSKVALEAQHAEYEQVTAPTNARGLNAGHLFTLSKFKRDDQNREHLVVAMKSLLHVHAPETTPGHDEGSSYSAQAIVLDSKVPFRRRQATPKPSVRGPQTAIVTGKKGEELWTDEHGRVKVKFHWDRKGKPDEQSSCWVRVAQAWAGPGFGSMFIPRIGQEVLVEFLEGDPDRPIVTGCLYNGAHAPPWGLPAKASQSGIKTRTTKGGGEDDGNELRFEDEKGHEELHIKAQRDLTVEVKRNHEVKIEGHYKAETVQQIDISSKKSIKIHCGPRSTIEMNSSKIKLSVGGSVIEIDAVGIVMNAPVIKLNS